ncbi:MAG TPA: hypothetical protein VN709_02820 [Terriglobales bacterium]|nr:hypothetical protein [Terriglobales bacterium]
MNAALSTPATLRRRTRLAVSEVLAEVCGARWPRHLRALILTGSMARDEATAYECDGVLTVAGDAECLAVFSRRWDIPAARGFAQAALDAERRLRAQAVACPVGVSGVAFGYLRDNPPHCFGLELRQAGRVIWGDLDVLGLMPGYSACDIPLRDGFNLLSNRMVEYLAAATAPAAALDYAALKLGLDTGTAYLISRRRFVTGYAARQQVLARLSAPCAAETLLCTQLKLAAAPPALTAEQKDRILQRAIALWHTLRRRLPRATWPMRLRTAANSLRHGSLQTRTRIYAAAVAALEARDFSSAGAIVADYRRLVEHTRA